jgi:hypothetical protein
MPINHHCHSSAPSSHDQFWHTAAVNANQGRRKAPLK